MLIVVFVVVNFFLVDLIIEVIFEVIDICLWFIVVFGLILNL